MPAKRTQNLYIAAALGLAAIVALRIGESAFESPGTQNPSYSARAIVSRPLVFRDGGEGDILVYDTNADKPFVVLRRDANSFIANTVRLLATERRRRNGEGPSAPFTLTRWSDGRLSLADPSTGETVELGAFGLTNARSFAQLLPPAATGL